MFFTFRWKYVLNWLENFMIVFPQQLRITWLPFYKLVCNKPAHFFICNSFSVVILLGIYNLYDLLGMSKRFSQEPRSPQIKEKTGLADDFFSLKPICRFSKSASSYIKKTLYYVSTCLQAYIQAFLDFYGFNFRNFQFTAVYNSFLFSFPLVLQSNLDLRGFCFCGVFGVSRLRA